MKKTSKNSMDVYGAAGKSNVLAFDPEAVVLVDDPAHPLFDERVNLPISEALVKNIMFHGVLEPIIVRKNPETGKTEVVVGRQRTKACREANRRLKEQGAEPIMLPATVRRGDDGALAGVMVSENEIREGDSPMNRAKKMARLLNMGKTEDDLATIFGCTKGTVKNSLAILDCCAAVRNAVDDNKISVTMAYALAKLPAEEQKAKVEKMVAAGTGVNGKHQKSRAQKEAAGTTKTAPSKKEISDYRADLEEKCTDHDYKVTAIMMLDFVLGERGKPRFPRAS